MPKNETEGNFIMKKALSAFFALAFVVQLGLFSTGSTESVITAYAAAKVAVASVKLTPSAIKLAAGNTGTVKATVSPSTATNKAVSWKSSNTAVVTVSSNGTVTALSIGTATITCTAKDGSGKKAVCKATVVSPTTPAQILAAYTTVMNKAKASKPAYKKIEYQTLPTKDQHMEGSVVAKLLPQANRFMTTKDEVKTENNAKGSDMKWFPLYKASKGCLLKNANAIKTASFAKLPNGNYKITIVLKNEVNPEPYKSGNSAPSNVGAMFDPIEKASIDDTLKNDSAVKILISDAKYSLTYMNCTAVLEYNPKTNRVVSLEQNMSTFINITAGKVLHMFSCVGTAMLYNKLKVWDVKY